MKNLNKKSGQGLVEYSLVLALIALVVVASLTAMGESTIKSLYGNISGNLTNAEQEVTKP